MSTFWLLESSALNPIYIGVVNGIINWVDDKDKALRLSRREDADALAELLDDCWQVKEHIEQSDTLCRCVAGERQQIQEWGECSRCHGRVVYELIHSKDHFEPDALAAKIAQRIWEITEEASIKLAAAEPHCNYVPAPEEFKREMLKQYEQIISSALEKSGGVA